MVSTPQQGSAEYEHSIITTTESEFLSTFFIALPRWGFDVSILPFCTLPQTCFGASPFPMFGVQ